MTDKVLAFGVEPSVSKYRLRLARYPALAQSVTDYVSESAAEQPRLLDIGVGYGRTYRYVQQLGLADRIDWHGVDLRRLPKDEMAGAGAWNVSLANVEEGLPFPDDHFDVVIAEQILEHLQRPDRALQEICRVARPGAQVIIGVPIFPGPIARLRNAYIRLCPKTFAKSGSGHLQTFSLKDDSAPLLREHGTARGAKRTRISRAVRRSAAPPGELPLVVAMELLAGPQDSRSVRRGSVQARLSAAERSEQPITRAGHGSS
ncbi:MAG: class I SAM-dependent methyltransferase [Gammaproteobacteria bacterium]|nr:class I SAM-dependent methyltransferase [Gammaproteobacteria bacterium]